MMERVSRDLANIMSKLAIKLGFAITALIIICGMFLLSSSTNENTRFKQGEVISSTFDSSQKSPEYSYYIPYAADLKKKLPVLVIFDPFANGRSVIYRYRQLADKYGYILIASDVSSNFRSVSQNYLEVDKIFSVLKFFPIDQSRIYTTGYSGGSHVAVYAAMVKQGVAGVIICGGTFPPVEPSTNAKFDIAIIGGLADHNRVNHLKLYNSRRQPGRYYTLIEFAGFHEWAPFNYMEDAFRFLEFNAMRENFKPHDNEMISGFILMQKDKITNFMNKGDYYTAVQEAEKTINYVGTLTNINYFQGIINQLQNEPKYIRSKQLEFELQRKEIDLVVKFADAFNKLLPVSWWIGEFNNIINDTKSVPSARMRERVFAWVNLVTSNCKIGQFAMPADYCSAIKNEVEKSHLMVIIRKILDAIRANNPEIIRQQQTRLRELNFLDYELHKESDVASRCPHEYLFGYDKSKL